MVGQREERELEAYGSVAVARLFEDPPKVGTVIQVFSNSREQEMHVVERKRRIRHLESIKLYTSHYLYAIYFRFIQPDSIDVNQLVHSSRIPQRRSEGLYNPRLLQRASSVQRPLVLPPACPFQSSTKDAQAVR